MKNSDRVRLVESTIAGSFMGGETLIEKGSDGQLINATPDNFGRVAVQLDSSTTIMVRMCLLEKA